MSQPFVRLHLDEHLGPYRPGEELAGQFSLHAIDEHEVRAVELSVLWHTEGKGEEDLSVHYFRRFEPRNGEAMDFRSPRRFNTALPNSPLSYAGQIVTIRWCVRVRAFLPRGKQLALEVPFQLGHLPQPALAET